MKVSVIDIAKICHQANKSYCEAVGDDTQVDWHLCQDWQKESAINGVKFNLDNPGAPASASHDSWLKEKLENGWKYGPIKNAHKKEHPCCVNYEELPDYQKLKDLLFKSIANCFTRDIN